MNIDEKIAEFKANIESCERVCKMTAIGSIREAAKRTMEDCKQMVEWLEDYKRLKTEQNKWIPTSERLPKENGRYLATRGLNACGTLWNRVYIINYSDLMGLKSEKIWWSGNVGKSDFETYDDVVAWCELPLPYKAESGGEE